MFFFAYIYVRTYDDDDNIYLIFLAQLRKNTEENKLRRKIFKGIFNNFHETTL